MKNNGTPSIDLEAQWYQLVDDFETLQKEVLYLRARANTAEGRLRQQNYVKEQAVVLAKQAVEIDILREAAIPAAKKLEDAAGIIMEDYGDTKALTYWEHSEALYDALDYRNRY